MFRRFVPTRCGCFGSALPSSAITTSATATATAITATRTVTKGVSVRAGGTNPHWMNPRNRRRFIAIWLLFTVFMQVFMPRIKDGRAETRQRHDELYGSRAEKEGWVKHDDPVADRKALLKDLKKTIGSQRVTDGETII